MSKGLKVFAVFLWICFLGCLGAILYLSFQNGEEAKALGSDIILKAAQRRYNMTEVPEEVLLSFTYKVRQMGRLLIFALLGVLGTSTIHVTFHKLHWLVRALISVVMLVGIAIFTEKFKIYLPTRHFSGEEMGISIVGAMLGFVFVSVVTFVFSIIRWIGDKIISKNKTKNKRKR